MPFCVALVGLGTGETRTCENPRRLSLEGLVMHLLKAVRQEPSEQMEYCAFFSVELVGLGT